ncbi:hypothetical protein [Herbiconiux sp. UC225_62]|uniref:hypothetical protein n=1 Tax=Herbiconiux sp. UC225_62 TaxID=3350168 RepID=UPI0036D32B16
MGIHYFAYPLHPVFVDTAVSDPRTHLDSDEFHQFFMHGEPGLATLDLDKCWREMQGLFGSRPDRPSRPAHQLVEGEVTPACCGWYGFYRAVTPAAMYAIADDFAAVNDEDIREALGPEACADNSYVQQMLDRARNFTREVTRRGMGAVYHIG